MEEQKKKGPKKYRVRGGQGDPAFIRVKHPSFGWIAQDELTPKKIKQLKQFDADNGTEFMLCIIEE